MSALPRALSRAASGVRWYLREISGEARWEAHVRHCAEHGHPVPSRRDYERRRSALRGTGARCC